MGQSSSPSASAAPSSASCSSATIPPWHENKPPDERGSQGDTPKGDGEPHDKNQSAETESDAEKQWRLGEGKHHAPGGKYAEETRNTSPEGLHSRVRSPRVPTTAVAEDVKAEPEQEPANDETVEKQGLRQQEEALEAILLQAAIEASAAEDAENQPAEPEPALVAQVSTCQNKPKEPHRTVAGDPLRLSKIEKDNAKA